MISGENGKNLGWNSKGMNNTNIMETIKHIKIHDKVSFKTHRASTVCIENIVYALNSTIAIASE